MMMVKKGERAQMAMLELAEGASSATIYDRIWTAIAERKLRPGTRLKEEKLSEIFDVSRARVRQALASLEHDGLVTIIPNRGAFVAEPTIEEARDIFFARKTIEGRLVERLCGVATPEMLGRLHAHVASERAARLRGDASSVIRLSGGFHILIGELAGSEYLAEVLRDLVSRTSLIIAMYQPRSHDDCGPEEHDAIVALISQGKPDKVVAAMTDHLGHIEQQLNLDADVAREVDLEQILK